MRGCRLGSPFPCLRQDHLARHVRGAEVELRTIVGEERRMTATFILGQDVALRLEFGVRRDGAGLGQNLAALDFFAFGAAEKRADIIARFALIEQLAEHFDALSRHVLVVARDDRRSRISSLILMMP